MDLELLCGYVYLSKCTWLSVNERRPHMRMCCCYLSYLLFFLRNSPPAKSFHVKFDHWRKYIKANLCVLQLCVYVSVCAQSDQQWSDYYKFIIIFKSINDCCALPQIAQQVFSTIASLFFCCHISNLLNPCTLNLLKLSGKINSCAMQCIKLLVYMYKRCLCIINEGQMPLSHSFASCPSIIVKRWCFFYLAAKIPSAKKASKNKY